MSELSVKTRTQAFLEKHFSGEFMDYRQLISLFIPVLVDQAFVTCLNLLNTAMISTSGVAAVSAVNMVDSLNFFLVNVFIAVSTGGTVVVAQYKGSGNDRMVSKSAAGSVSSVFLLAFAIAVTVLSLHGPLLRLLFGGAQADVFHNARIYIIGSCLSYCGIATEEAVCGALRGVGETRATLSLSIIMNFTYVLLNVLFINVLHMGIIGMVISLNLSRYLGAACAIFYLLKFHSTLNFRFRDLFAFNFAILGKIFFIGLPYAAEQMFFNGGKLLTQTFIVSLGTFAIDTNAICSSMVGLVQIPANALALTVITVVGQCIGRGAIKDARKFVRSFLMLASCSFLLMSLILHPLFYPLVSLFHPPAAIIPHIYLIVLVTNIAQIPLWPISFITPSALRAAGDSRYTSVVAMLSMWMFRVVLGYLLGIVFRFGIVGVWVAMDCEWGVRGMIFLTRYRGTKWYRHRLVD